MAHKPKRARFNSRVFLSFLRKRMLRLRKSRSLSRWRQLWKQGLLARGTAGKKWKSPENWPPLEITFFPPHLAWDKGLPDGSSDTYGHVYTSGRVFTRDPSHSRRISHGQTAKVDQVSDSGPHPVWQSSRLGAPARRSTRDFCDAPAPNSDSISISFFSVIHRLKFGIDFQLQGHLKRNKVEVFTNILSPLSS